MNFARIIAKKYYIFKVILIFFEKIGKKFYRHIKKNGVEYKKEI